MRRYDLSDGQKAQIKSLLPAREGHTGETTADNRLHCRSGSSSDRSSLKGSRYAIKLEINFPSYSVTRFCHHRS